MVEEEPGSRVDPIEHEMDAIHRRAAEIVRRDPSLVEEARATVARWIERNGNPAHPVLLEWSAVLRMLTPAELADFLESRLPQARRLRGSSPFPALARVRDAAR